MLSFLCDWLSQVMRTPKISERMKLPERLINSLYKIIIRKVQGEPQGNNVAFPKHQLEEEKSLNRNHIITSKR